MSKVVAFKTLIFKNLVYFTKRGRVYPDIIISTARTLHNLNFEFLTEDGQTVSILDDPNSEYHIDNLFKDYEKVKIEKENKEHKSVD